MHIADVGKGMLGANGIVGGTPLACEAPPQRQGQEDRPGRDLFFGDGASNQGTTMEGMNLAGVWKLPVVFVCENNGYAETTSPKFSVSGQDIAARGFGLPSVAVDGLDLFAIYEAAGEAIGRARRGEGPTFVEAQTYRYYGRFEGDSIKYRTKEEEEHYRGMDCLVRFRDAVTQQGLLTTELDEIDQKALTTIDDAVKFADQSPVPQSADILNDVYVNFPQRELWPFQTVAFA